MNNGVKMSYETMAASSFMTVTFPPDVELVNYQMEMMLENEIENFLHASRQIVDGETVIYYNITSRISLKQVLDKRKLSRKELIRLIEGAILASRDAAAYRLPSTGIVLAPEYIYVNPASCSPAFMFLPIQEPDGPGIKELISELVLHDKIELSDDNFVQVILMELNRQPFSLEQLEKILKPYKKPEYSMQRQDQKPEILQQEILKPEVKEHLSYQKSELRVEKVLEKEPVAVRAMEKPKFSAMSNGNSVENGKRLRNSHKNTEENCRISEKDTFDLKQAKKRFMLLQVFALAALIICIFGRIFIDKSGGISSKNILTFVIVVTLTEWILYRELYVNGRYSKKSRDKKSANAKKNTGEKTIVRAEIPQRPELPIQKPSNQEALRPVPSRQQFSEPVLKSIEEPVYTQQSRPYSMYNRDEDTDIGSETEFWSEGIGDGTPAYLEYFDNGRLSRILVDSLNGIVVGRLKQQVDFEVKSPRVGKVHARFFCQDGQYYVVDINSKNGTYINGSRTRIESNIPYPLHDKDRITLADSEFTIRCSEN